LIVIIRFDKGEELVISINLYLDRNMARGPKKHQKRVATPKSWMLSKLGGVYV
jgi:hypothetical protein